MHALAALALGLAVAACGSEPADEPSSVRGPQRGPQRGTGPASEAPAAVGPAVRTPVTPDREAAQVREAARTPQAWGAGTIEETETRTETTPGAPPPRDLGAELRDAIGLPTECVDAEAARALSDTLRVPVRAHVTATGRITRAEVGGSAPERVRSCIDARVESLALRGPIEGAPREVSTELVLEVRPDRVPAAVPSQAPEVPLPPGAVAPGITLPARGGDDPAPGFVAPSSTLPAVGSDERPAGFVPPSSTLPAMAE